MLINTEEKAKIAVLCVIGSVLMCSQHFILGGGCFALLLPWSALGRVTSWLAEPVVVWRLRRKNHPPEPVEAVVPY